MPPSLLPPLTPLQHLLLLSSPLLPLILYLSTLFPTIAGGDSPELVAASCTQSVPHPPGYPTLLGLTGLAQTLTAALAPTTNPAYAANVLTAVTAASASTAVLLLTLSVAHLTRGGGERANDTAVAVASKGKFKGKFKGKGKGGMKPAVHTTQVSPESPPSPVKLDPTQTPLPLHHFLLPCLTTTLFTTTPLIWSYTTHHEVFPLNNLLTASLFLATLRYHGGESSVSLYIGGLVCGLCVTNQHTSVLYIIPCVLSIIYKTPTLLTTHRPRLYITACATLLGLSPYLYLVYRSHCHAVDSWGDQRTVEGFLTHFLRREYGTFVLASEWESGERQDWEKYWRRMELYWGGFGEETANLGPFFVAIFTVHCAMRRSSVGVVMISYFLYLAVFNYLANLTFSDLHVEVLRRMWQQAAVAGYVGMGGGVVIFVRGVERYGGERFRQGVKLLTFAAVGGGIFAVIAARFPAMDRRHVTIFHDYAVNVVSGLPRGATVMTNDDMNCNTLHYLGRCEGVRGDLNIVKIPLITYDWWKPMQLEHFGNLKDTFPGTRHHPFDPDGFSMKEFLDVNVGEEGEGRPEVYVLGDWKTGDDSQDVYPRVTYGLIDRVMKPGSAVDLLEYARKNREVMPRFDMVTTIEEVAGSWELVVLLKYVAAYLKVSHYVANEIGRYQGTLAEKLEIGEVGVEIYDMLRDVVKLDAHSALWVQRSVFRNAGVVAGMVGGFADQSGDEDKSRHLAGKMFAFWDVFMQMCEVEDAWSEKDCKEVVMFVDHGVNPYSQQKFKSEAGFEWLGKYDGWYKDKY